MEEHLKASEAARHVAEQELSDALTQTQIARVSTRESDRQYKEYRETKTKAFEDTQRFLEQQIKELKEENTKLKQNNTELSNQLHLRSQQDDNEVDRGDSEAAKEPDAENTEENPDSHAGTHHSDVQSSEMDEDDDDDDSDGDQGLDNDAGASAIPSVSPSPAPEQNGALQESHPGQPSPVGERELENSRVESSAAEPHTSEESTSQATAQAEANSEQLWPSRVYSSKTREDAQQRSHFNQALKCQEQVHNTTEQLVHGWFERTAKW